MPTRRRSAAVSKHRTTHECWFEGPAPAGSSSFLDCFPVVLFAHGIVGRADLPIPVSGFIVAAAAVLVISFVALAGGWSQPRLEQHDERRLLPIPLAVEVLLGALGLFVFVVT